MALPCTAEAGGSRPSAFLLLSLARHDAENLQRRELERKTAVRVGDLRRALPFWAWIALILSTGKRDRVAFMLGPRMERKRKSAWGLATVCDSNPFESEDILPDFTAIYRTQTSNFDHSRYVITFFAASTNAIRPNYRKGKKAIDRNIRSLH